MSTLQVSNRLIAECLLKIVLADQDAATSSAEELAKQAYWRRTLHLAKIWRVVPQFKNRIDTLALPVDLNTAHELREAHIQSSARSMMALHLCSLIFREFNRKQLPAVAFKGVGLIGSLYQGPTDRSMNDIDILVRPEDLKHAYRTVRTLGFTPITDRLTSYSDFLEDNAIVLTNNDGFELDLHAGQDSRRGSTVLSAKRIIARAETVDMRGAPVLVPNPFDAMMITVQHSLHHNFDPTETVRDMCDLRRWWTVHSKMDIGDAVSEVTKYDLLEPCLAVWTILRKLGPSNTIADMTEQLSLNASAAEVESAQNLRGLFEYQLGSKAISTLLLRIMADPLGMGRYLASRVKKGAANLHALPNAQRKEPTGQVILNEVSRFVWEILSLNSDKLGFYQALVRAHMKHPRQ